MPPGAGRIVTTFEWGSPWWLAALPLALFPLWAHHPSTAGLRVHLANGLYLNALLDRMIGGFRTAAKN